MNMNIQIQNTKDNMTNGIIPIGVDTFFTKTQYDKSFDYLFTDFVNAKRGVSGPVFAIVTASEYLKSPILTKEKHEMNINRAVTISSMLTLREHILLETILKDTDIPINSITKTTVNNVQVKDPTLLNVVPDISHIGKFCTIIHKNNKYFVI